MYVWMKIYNMFTKEKEKLNGMTSIQYQLLPMNITKGGYDFI
jgi:hypothetical protein